MCVFCASAPAVMAVGVGMQAKQRKECKAAEARGEKLPKPKVAAGPATVLVLIAVFAASAIFHSNNYA
jgi:hypothetical protein